MKNNSEILKGKYQRKPFFVQRIDSSTHVISKKRKEGKV